MVVELFVAELSAEEVKKECPSPLSPWLKCPLPAVSLEPPLLSGLVTVEQSCETVVPCLAAKASSHRRATGPDICDADPLSELLELPPLLKCELDEPVGRVVVVEFSAVFADPGEFRYALHRP